MIKWGAMPCGKYWRALFGSKSFYKQRNAGIRLTGNAKNDCRLSIELNSLYGMSLWRLSVYMDDMVRKMNDWMQRRGVKMFGRNHREWFLADYTMLVIGSA